MDWGGCLHSRIGVSLGKLVRNPFSRAIVRVERAGENWAAWAKATESAVCRGSDAGSMSCMGWRDCRHQAGW